MFFTNTTKDSVNYDIEPTYNIQVGDIIEMTRTGKRFSVEVVTPTGFVLKEQKTAISFSRSALSERLRREAAKHIAF
jgi:ribosomal 50S subunit-recycling heat shock protein